MLFSMDNTPFHTINSTLAMYRVMVILKYKGLSDLSLNKAQYFTLNICLVSVFGHAHFFLSPPAVCRRFANSSDIHFLIIADFAILLSWDSSDS